MFMILNTFLFFILQRTSSRVFRAMSVEGGGHGGFSSCFLRVLRVLCGPFFVQLWRCTRF